MVLRSGILGPLNDFCACLLHNTKWCTWSLLIYLGLHGTARCNTRHAHLLCHHHIHHHLLLLHHKAHLCWFHRALALHQLHHILLLLHLHGKHGVWHYRRTCCRWYHRPLCKLRYSQSSEVVWFHRRPREELGAGFAVCITHFGVSVELILIDCHHVRLCALSFVYVDTYGYRDWLLVVAHDLNTGLLRWFGLLGKLIGELIGRGYSTRAYVGVHRNVSIVNIGSWVNSVSLCRANLMTILLTTLHNDVVEMRIKGASAII